MDAVRSIVHAFASLRFAAVLLMMALVAMTHDTFYETLHGLELTRRAAYDSRWFRGILALIAVNVTSALIVRYPFSKRWVGVVITHDAILFTLLGGVVKDGSWISWNLDALVFIHKRGRMVQGCVLQRRQRERGVLGLSHTE